MTTNIHFSSTVFTNVVSASSSAALIYGGGTGNPTYITCATIGATLLNIYKGTIATFPAFTTTTSRTADLLMTMSLGSPAVAYNTGTSSNSIRVQVGISNVPGATASASGLATWFLLNNSVTGTVTDLTGRSAIIGTIGTIGSGADMEVYDTNIVSGNSYKSLGFWINFPYDMTF
jgi:hypothetical protein